MGIGMIGYKCMNNDASCSRGTFKVFLDTVEETSNRLKKNKALKKHYNDFLKGLEEKYRVDVLKKLTTYSKTCIMWSGDEVRALREFLDYIDGAYINTLEKNYKGYNEDLLFYIRHFMRVKHTLLECDLFFITL